MQYEDQSEGGILGEEELELQEAEVENRKEDLEGEAVAEVVPILEEEEVVERTTSSRSVNDIFDDGWFQDVAFARRDKTRLRSRKPSAIRRVELVTGSLNEFKQVNLMGGQ